MTEIELKLRSEALSKASAKELAQLAVWEAESASQTFEDKKRIQDALRYSGVLPR